jgi:hypothetical protein
LRPDLPRQCGELLATMLAKDPGTRPDALAVAHALPLTLQTADWRELVLLGNRAYDDTDVALAIEQYERAVFLAPRDDRFSPEYMRMLVRFFDVTALADSGVRVALFPRVAHLVADVSMNGPESASELGGTVLAALLTQVLALGSPDDAAKEARQETVRTVVRFFLDHRPRPAAAPTMRLLLTSLSDPVCWSCRADLFLVAAALVQEGSLEAAFVAGACVAASRTARVAGDELTQAQVWLRRAGRLGGEKTPSFLAEQEEVDREIQKTATPVRLPLDAPAQATAEDTVGEAEQGHLQVQRIQEWVGRLLGLFRWVESVRRVRKDPDLETHSTRILELRNLPQHLTAARGVEPERIIPAVLDGTFSKPPGIALRVNIVLPKGTTEAQRAAAIDALRGEKSLFP